MGDNKDENIGTAVGAAVGDPVWEQAVAHAVGGAIVDAVDGDDVGMIVRVAVSMPWRSRWFGRRRHRWRCSWIGHGECNSQQSCWRQGGSQVMQLEKHSDKPSAKQLEISVQCNKKRGHPICDDYGAGGIFGWYLRKSPLKNLEMPPGLMV